MHGPASVEVFFSFLLFSLFSSNLFPPLFFFSLSLSSFFFSAQVGRLCANCLSDKMGPVVDFDYFMLSLAFVSFFFFFSSLMALFFPEQYFVSFKLINSGWGSKLNMDSLSKQEVRIKVMEILEKVNHFFILSYLIFSFLF